VLSLVGGWVGLPFMKGGNPFERWLAPVFEAEPMGALLGTSSTFVRAPVLSPLTEWLLVATSGAGVSVLGIFMAYRAYVADPTLATRLRERWAGAYRALLNKYWVDELYDRIAVEPIYRGSLRLWRFWDEKVVDGAVNGIAYLIEGVSAMLRLLQTGFVGTYALFIAVGAAALIFHFLRH